MMDMDLVNLKNVAFLVMDDFYRNRSARLSDEIKRVVNETRVRITEEFIIYVLHLDFFQIIYHLILLLKFCSFIYHNLSDT